MKKKFLLSFLFLGMLLTLSGCGGDHTTAPDKSDVVTNTETNTEETSTEVTTEEVIIDTREEIEPKSTLTTIDLASEYDIIGESLKTYRYKYDDRNISYVNIEEFIAYMQGGIIELEVLMTDQLKLSYTFSVDEAYQDQLDIETYTYEMVIDASTNQISFNDFDMLDQLNGETESDYITDIELVGFDEVTQDYSHEIDLSLYDFEIIDYEEGYYIPLFLANLFFTGSNINVYEMKDHIYLLDYATDFTELIDEFGSNKYIISDVKTHTTNYLALYFDHFYGLKDHHKVTSYKHVITDFDIDKQTTADNFYRQIDQFLMRRDDLHTSLITAGYRNKNYTNSTNYKDDEKMNAYLNAYVNNACYNRNEEITYGADGNTMIISINSFTQDTKDLIAPIMEASKNYQDVIFDLSCNSGGLVAGVLEVFAYLTDQPIPMSYLNPAIDTVYTEYYQSSNSKYIDKNYYLRTSEATFSAANLFASLFREMNIGPILGKSTSGGAAAITYTVLPDGAIIVSSSNMVFINEDQEVIEDGIKVDLDTNYYNGWWRNINQFKNKLKDTSIQFDYDNTSESFKFNLSIGEIEAGIEIEEFLLTFRNFHTNELEKEFVFTDSSIIDSFIKTNQLDDYKVIIRAKYTYQSVFSDDVLYNKVIDKDLGIVGDYTYTEVDANTYFTMNALEYRDVDVVQLNLTEEGVYSITSTSGDVTAQIYDAEYNLIERFKETTLTEGTYYVLIERMKAGNHRYFIKALVDDQEGNTIIDLVNGDNLNHATIDYVRDSETFEFTLTEDKIITLSSDNIGLFYRIYDSEGNIFNENNEVHYNYYNYTYLFPKGTYTIDLFLNSSYGSSMDVRLNAHVIDANYDVYTDDFSKVSAFGTLLIGENQISIDHIKDHDIYAIEITEPGTYVFEGDYLVINKIDENGDYSPLVFKRVFELEAGTHYFAFSRNYHESSINNLIFNRIIDESDEANHLKITIGEEVTTKVNDYNDQDYFDFIISEAGLYQVDFSSDNAHVSFVIYNAIDEIVPYYDRYDREFDLTEGNYTIVLSQPTINGNNLRNATFTIEKK